MSASGGDAPARTLRIGILTYNALAHTQRCIASLQAYASTPWHATIVDNHSTDDSPAWLAALNDPRITVELRSDNLGVGGGRNRLFSLMLPSMADDDLLVFLDNDIEVGAGWELPFLEAFAASPRLGVAGRWAFSMQVHDDWRDILPEHNSNAGPVDTVQGCCFWVRAQTARALVGFDETLGRFWHEDDDYCIRALHAGWDVQRVRSSAIQHHEHGSGEALRPERIAGSLANQAFLARKWRSFDAIDGEGIPRRPCDEPAAALRAQLGARLNRGAALLRTELNNAIEDATRLLHTEISDSRAAILATPVVRTLLADSIAHETGDVPARAAAAQARIAAVLSTRRTACGAPAPVTRGSRGFSAICNPSAWDDARWRESFLAAFRDGSGRDFYCRTETLWRDGQLAHALRTTAALKRSARVLLIGHATERLIAAMTHAVGHVTVLDNAPAPPIFFSSSAGRPLGAATVTSAAWPPSVLPADDADRFDIVLCPNFSRYSPPAQSERVLHVLARFAKPDGFVAIGASVRLSGPRDGRWLEPTFFADDAALARIGVRRIGQFDGAVADETLLAAVPPDEHPHWRPRLARETGPHIVSLATLVARRLTDRVADRA